MKDNTTMNTATATLLTIEGFVITCLALSAGLITWGTIKHYADKRRAAALRVIQTRRRRALQDRSGAHIETMPTIAEIPSVLPDIRSPRGEGLSAPAPLPARDAYAAADVRRARRRHPDQVEHVTAVIDPPTAADDFLDRATIAELRRRVAKAEDERDVLRLRVARTESELELCGAPSEVARIIRDQGPITSERIADSLGRPVAAVDAEARAMMLARDGRPPQTVAIWPRLAQRLTPDEIMSRSDDAPFWAWAADAHRYPSNTITQTVDEWDANEFEQLLSGLTTVVAA